MTNITVADAGTYSVIASNLGGSATSSGAVLTVAKADSSTTLAPLISSATVQPVTFAATVVSPAGTPTGQVAFKDGTNSLGLVPLLSGGATLSGVSLTAGEHAITAVYSGDDNFNASTATGRQRLGFFLLTPGGQPDGGFSLLGSGNPGQTSILELTDLTAFPWQWTPVDTNTADTNGVFHFSQPGGTNEGARLYRLRWPGP